jgi:hypothetical protein
LGDKKRWYFRGSQSNAKNDLIKKILFYMYRLMSMENSWEMSHSKKRLSALSLEKTTKDLIQKVISKKLENFKRNTD